MVGKTLGQYEILEPLGKGGMGEVYRARDTRLKRDVAIKVLPAEFADDPQRFVRLEREAKLLARLNHPNIALVHALEGEGEATFLVLELVEGESLEQMLARGPLPVAKALDVCGQIARALEAAHGEGIIHRDLKPANVLVTRDGQAKVLDFGIAKSLGLHAGIAATAQPTNLTIGGMLIGTPSFMSPEQVRGESTDGRTDIWALGCVLFETLTAKSAFAKRTLADTLAAIVDQDPDWSSLPDETPPQVRYLIARCLRKEPQRRLHDVADARIEIEDVLGGSAHAAPARLPSAAVEATRAVRWKLALALAIASAGMAAFAVWFTIPPPPEPVVASFSIEYPEGTTFRTGTTRGVAISPDGRWIVFDANRQLWLRAIDDPVARPIRGTESPSQATAPFFSPDSTRLGFWADGQIKSVSIAGGPPVQLGPAPDRAFGASWADDGYIYFGQGARGIQRVPEGGGAAEVVIEMKEGELAYGPQLLPGGDWLLFTLLSGSASWDDASIVAQSVSQGARKLLVARGTDGRSAPTGHLLYSLDGNLLAVPFDDASVEVTGGPVSLIEGVQRSARDANDFSVPLTGASQYAFSDVGGLVYIPADARGTPEYPLVWIDRGGTVTPLPFSPRNFSFPRLSPDERRIAVQVVDATNVSQIWIYDIDGRSFPLTSEGSNSYPIWSPNGEWVYFDSDRGGDRDVWRQRVDRRGEAELVWGGEGRQTPYSITDDGARLLFFDPYSSEDIWILLLDEPRRAENLVASPDVAMLPRFSPDGSRFIFESTESGSSQVSVQEVSTRARTQVSTAGGHRPVWSPDGSEIFYWTGSAARAEMYVVAVNAQAAAEFSPPARLFEFQPTGDAGNFSNSFDVTRDGQRFLMLGPDVTPSEPRLVVVLNWFEQLKRSVAAGR